MSCKPDHRGSHIRTRDKAVRRHVRHDLRFCVVLDSQGQGTVILGTRTFLHAVRHFLLNHDSDVINRHAALKEPHDDRGRDIIRQVCNNLDRLSAVVFLGQCLDIYSQDVLVDDGDVIVVRQCLL